MNLINGKQREELGTPSGSIETILVHDELTLFKDEKDEYFFTTKYFDHGKCTKADPDSARKYIEEFKNYESELYIYKLKQKQISENMSLLKSTLI